jgi:hypothetical protein
VKSKGNFKKFYLIHSKLTITMKVINILSVLFLLALVSCKPEANVETNSKLPTVSTEKKMKYKVDGVEMSKDAFYGQFSSLLSKKNGGLNVRNASESEMLGIIAEDNRVVWEIDRPESDGTFDVTDAFTSDQEYIEYAVNSGYSNAAQEIAAYNHLSEYAESSGALDELNNTGNVPSNYIQYMDSYLSSQGLPTSELQNKSGNQLHTRSLTNFVSKGCVGDGDSWPIRTNPWLGMFGFNNNISSFEPIGFLGGRTDIYDRSFWRSHLLGVWSWAQVKWSLCNAGNFNQFSVNFSFANDKATSWSSF